MTLSLRSLVLGLALLATFPAASIAEERNERAWCQALAPKYGAEVEVRLWDGTRCDLLSATEAIEVDWAAKAYEAVGQAVWYSIVTGRRPAVLLLVRDPAKEARHIYRATAICTRLDITLYLEITTE